MTDIARASDLETAFEMVQGFKSNSASNTDIWEAIDKRTQRRVIFKAYILAYYLEQNGKVTLERRKESDPDYALLIHETKVYRSLRDQLIIPYNVRNILCIAGEGRFTSAQLVNFIRTSTKVKPKLDDASINHNVLSNGRFLLDISRERSRASITSDRWVNTPPLTAADLKVPLKKTGGYVRFDKPVEYGCMVTPKINQLPFGQFIVAGGFTPKVFMNYFAVLLLTIFLMSTWGVNQNDLHWYNILMDDKFFGPDPRHKRKYFVVYGEEVYLIDNPYILYLYDFDRAAVSKHINQTLTSRTHYSQGGSCPKFHPKRDFVKTLCCAYKALQDLISPDDPQLVSIAAADKPEFMRIQDEIFRTLVLTDELRSAITDANTYCWMTKGDTSVMCSDSIIEKGLVTRERIVEWALGRTSYARFTLRELSQLSRSPTFTGAPEFPKLSAIFQQFRSDLPAGVLTEDELKLYVIANTQFVAKGARPQLGAWQKSPLAMEKVIQQMVQAMQH